MPPHPPSRAFSWLLGAALIVGFLVPRASAQAPVASGDLPRGTVIEAQHIRADSATHRTRSVDADRTARTGWVTRRLIREGEPLLAPAVRPPHLIAAGDSVEIVARRGTVSVRVRGVASGAAGRDEPVTVRIGPDRRLRGTAATAGVVHTSSPSEPR